MVPIFIPALRERPEDIPLLAEHFLRMFNRDNLRNLRFSDRATAVLGIMQLPRERPGAGELRAARGDANSG